jgi:DNA-binding transcriptional regulator YhcF (GntR family)
MLLSPSRTIDFAASSSAPPNPPRQNNFSLYGTSHSLSLPNVAARTEKEVTLMETVLIQREPSNQPCKQVRQEILRFLSKQTKPLPPVQIAKSTGLNRHSVRRELQQMLKLGILTRIGHAYQIAQPSNGTTSRTRRRLLRTLIGQLIDEYAKKDPSYLSEYTDRKTRIEQCIRAIDKATPYNGAWEVKRLAQTVFGREEHGDLVMYETTPPEWYIKLRDLVDLDGGLTPTPIDEFKRVRDEDRKREILDRLKTDPYLLGDLRDFARKRSDELLQELRELGVSEAELNEFLEKWRPVAVKTIYNYWVKEMDWYQKQLARDILDLECALDRANRAEYALTWIEYAKQAYSDLARQAAALGVTPPELPWLSKYEAQIKYLAGVGERPDPPRKPENLTIIELEEPLPETPVTVIMRKRTQDANPRKHLKTSYGRAKTLLEQNLARLKNKLTTPAPYWRSFYTWEKPQPGAWYVVGRWSKREDAEDFLTDGHHANLVESEYWNWKKADAEFAVLQWRGEYWPAIRLPVQAPPEHGD